VDLLLTKNPLFKIVAEKFATKHPFEELSVPMATVEGMILLKLFALLERHVLQTDLTELKKTVSEEKQRIAKVEHGIQS